MTDTTSVAFIGRAAAGKTTAANMLGGRGHARLGFADALRALGPIHADANAPDWPELIREWVYQFRIPSVLDGGQLNELEAGILRAFNTYPRLEGKNRPLLQNIGTHVGRGIDDYLWIKLLLSRAAESAAPVALDDCRFDNEARALKQAGFCLTYLWATEATLDRRYAALYGAPMTPDQKAHPSESGIPMLRGLCHYVIHNDGDDLNELYNEVEFIADAAYLIRGVAV
jgi:hypothetical protein